MAVEPVVEPLTEAELEAIVEDELNELFRGDVDDVPIEALCDALRKREPRIFEEAEGQEAVEDALERMEAANKVMYREDRIHLI